MSYRTAYFCISCKGELDWSTMMHSHGTCPLCGHTNDSTGVDTFKVSYREDFEKQHVPFLWIFTIKLSVPVRYFKQTDINEHGIILTSENDRVI